MERKHFLNFLIIFMFIGLIVGLTNLDLVNGRKFRKQSDSNCIRLISQSGARGNILDRNGEIIVNNIISYDLMVLPQDIERIDQILGKISRILGTSVKELKDSFKKNFISVSVPVTVASNIDLKKAVVLGEIKSEEPGIIVTPKPLRNYPYAALG